MSTNKDTEATENAEGTEDTQDTAYYGCPHYDTEKARSRELKRLSLLAPNKYAEVNERQGKMSLSELSEMVYLHLVVGKRKAFDRLGTGIVEAAELQNLIDAGFAAYELWQRINKEEDVK